MGARPRASARPGVPPERLSLCVQLYPRNPRSYRLLALRKRLPGSQYSLGSHHYAVPYSQQA